MPPDASKSPLKFPLMPQDAPRCPQINTQYINRGAFTVVTVSSQSHLDQDPVNMADPVIAYTLRLMLAYDEANQALARRNRRDRRKRREQLDRLRQLQEQARAALPKKLWVRPWLTNTCRREYGQFEQLVKALQLQDRASFINFTRVPPDLFQEILARIMPMIRRQDTNYREALDPGLKLALTLRYLATGSSYKTLSYNFRCGVSSISEFLPEVCSAILEVFTPEAFTVQFTADYWMGVADKFQKKWNFPHAVGALDGKHVCVKKPPCSGSLYYNYKGFFSVPMLALVDADYCFMWVETGGLGHMSDSQIFLDSDLCMKLRQNELGLPPPSTLTNLPGDTTEVPYFLIADDAFALHTTLMKPFGRRNLEDKELIFNYRLSRARRVVENAFGILANRFRCFLRPFEQKPDTVRLIIKTAVTLHNILRSRAPTPGEGDSADPYAPEQEGTWRQHVQWGEVQQRNRQRVGAAAVQQRTLLMDYFNSPAGAVPWQWRLAGVPEPPVPGPEQAQ